MNTFLTIVGIHAALIGFGLIWAAFMSLMTPTDEEQEAIRKEFEAHRKKGFWRHTLFCFNQSYAARNRVMQNAFNHWPERPQIRKLVYCGAACLAIAVIIGIHLGTFNS